MVTKLSHALEYRPLCYELVSYMLFAYGGLQPVTDSFIDAQAMYFRFSKDFFKTQSRLLRFSIKWFDRAPGSMQVLSTRRNPNLYPNL